MSAATRLSFILLAAAAAVLIGCRPLPAGGADANEPFDAAALVGRWRLIRVDRVAPPGGSEKPTLEIAAGGAISGSTGVNRYSSRADAAALAEGRLVLEPIAATKRGAAPEAMAAERRFLDRLAAATRLTLDDDTLRLWVGDEEREALTFARESAPPH